MDLVQASIKRGFRLHLLIFVLILPIWSYQTQPIKTEEYHHAIETAIQQLPSKGILKQGTDGYVYLKVSNKYVSTLFPLVREPGFTVPTSIKRHTKTGAHISVLYKGEAAKIGSIQELGKTFSFEPKGIKIVHAGAKEYLILEVNAPGLEQMREHYGLPPKLMNHEFHITLGERYLYRHYIQPTSKMDFE